VGLLKYMPEIWSILTRPFTSRTSVVAAIEPDSLAKLVTNLNVAKCVNAESAYKVTHDAPWIQVASDSNFFNRAGIAYAMQLNAFGVYMLIAEYADWLGWPANLTLSATLFSNCLQELARLSWFGY